MRAVLNPRGLTTDNVVPLDNRSNSDVWKLIVMPFVDTNDASVSAHENFGSSGDFCRERESEIHFSAWCEVPLHRKVDTACRNVSSLAIMGAGLAIDWKPNSNRQRKIIPPRHATFRHSHWSSRIKLQSMTVP
jgi:hypothetical protein